MIVATWNVNSIRARMGLVVDWLKAQAPDVLLMQELKTAEFPAQVFEDLGYHCASVAQKTYNGVAIISRTPIATVSKTLPGDEQDSHARYLETIIDGIRIVNIYSPNGNPPGSDKFAYKLAWMDRFALCMRAWAIDATPTLIGGDYNVIPEDIDCHKPASWARDALFQPETRERYRAMLQMGFTDVFRELHPAELGQFTYWDYFRMAFDHNRGIRIDHFLASTHLKGRILSCEIDRNPRAQPKPSDHTPVILRLK